jgi:hypothetical protein
LECVAHIKAAGCQEDNRLNDAASASRRIGSDDPTNV